VTQLPQVPQTRQQTTMRKYMAILNQVNDLGALGFARVIDTASATDLDDLDRAADAVLAQLDRAQRLPR